MPAVLIRDVRIVAVGGVPAPRRPVDLLARDGKVVALAPRLTAPGREDGRPIRELRADGRWLIPGLWDHHVHMVQWSRTFNWLAMSGATSAEDALARVAARLAETRPGHAVIGFGHRSARWQRPPTVAELDGVAGEVPVVLISGDAHHGWLNSSALRLLGLPPRDDVLAESDWFGVIGRLGELPQDGAANERALAEAVSRAHALGVVGITDLEFGRNWIDWPERVAAGTDTLRVRAATYADTLDEVIAAGLRTGDPLPGGKGMVTMGPLKVISDGSLNTRTAWCHQPYADAATGSDPYGRPNLSADELMAVLRRATGAGLRMALHAIGDAAVGAGLDAFAATGATGSIEHAQLTTIDDVRRMGRLGVVASVQPAHLLDDRDVTAACWPDRAERCFMLRSMLDAGVALALGSDAPVSPLNPWLAMAAAVHRSADEREPWNPAEALTPAQALAASTDGATTVAVGSPADLVLLDADPLAAAEDSAAAGAALRAMPVAVAATLVGGRIVHREPDLGG